MVTVHDVTLFVGYDPELHEGNEKMEPFNAAAVQRMAKGTQSLISRGQHPQIAVSHPGVSMDGTADARPSVGRISAVRYELLNGIPTIKGDYQMSEADFDALIASNRYPRRSVEIFPKPLRIGTVALLGGDTPSSPVEDTMFSDRKRSIVVETSETTHFSETGIGGGAPAQPNYDWSMSMTDEMKNEIMAICREAIAAYMSEREKTAAEAAKTAESIGEERREAEQMSEADKRLQDAMREIEALKQARALDFADRKIAEMSASGMCIPAGRKDEIRAWIASGGPGEGGEKICALVTDLLKGATPTRRIDMSAAQPLGAKRILSVEETSRLAARHAGDTKGYLAAVEAAKHA